MFGFEPKLMIVGTKNILMLSKYYMATIGLLMIAFVKVYILLDSNDFNQHDGAILVKN